MGLDGLRAAGSRVEMPMLRAGRIGSCGHITGAVIAAVTATLEAPKLASVAAALELLSSAGASVFSSRRYQTAGPGREKLFSRSTSTPRAGPIRSRRSV